MLKVRENMYENRTYIFKSHSWSYAAIASSGKLKLKYYVKHFSCYGNSIIFVLASSWRRMSVYTTATFSQSRKFRISCSFVTNRLIFLHNSRFMNRSFHNSAFRKLFYHGYLVGRCLLSR